MTFISTSLLYGKKRTADERNWKIRVFWIRNTTGGDISCAYLKSKLERSSILMRVGTLRDALLLATYWSPRILLADFVRILEPCPAETCFRIATETFFAVSILNLTLNLLKERQDALGVFANRAPPLITTLCACSSRSSNYRFHALCLYAYDTLFVRPDSMPSGACPKGHVS